MDVLYFRLNRCQLYRDWDEFKQDKYKTLITEFFSSDSPEPNLYKNFAN